MVKDCEFCTDKFETRPGYPQARFCSRRCKALADAAKRRGQKTKYPTQPNEPAPLCACGCGQPVKWNRVRGDWSRVVGRHSTRPVVVNVSTMQIGECRTNKEGKRTYCLSCKKCGMVFAGDSNGKVYCPECTPEHYGKDKPNRVCAVCDSPFYDPGKVDVTCSPPCRRVWLAEIQKGDKSHRWQGGKTKKATLFRNSYQYADWRKAVFERDGYTCQICGVVGHKLAAHHIKPFSTHPELALETSNGITLCWPCHRSIKGKEAEYEDKFYAITKGQKCIVASEEAARRIVGIE